MVIQNSLVSVQCSPDHTDHSTPYLRCPHRSIQWAAVSYWVHCLKAKCWVPWFKACKRIAMYRPSYIEISGVLYIAGLQTTVSKAVRTRKQLMMRHSQSRTSNWTFIEDGRHTQVHEWQADTLRTWIHRAQQNWEGLLDHYHRSEVSSLKHHSYLSFCK